MWKIRVGIALAAVDIVLLAWLVSEHAYRWMVAGLPTP